MTITAAQEFNCAVQVASFADSSKSAMRVFRRSGVLVAFAQFDVIGENAIQLVFGGFSSDNKKALQISALINFLADLYDVVLFSKAENTKSDPNASERQAAFLNATGFAEGRPFKDGSRAFVRLPKSLF